MSTYRITYFDIDGGRAEPVRIALHAAGVDFEDRRISFQEFGQIRNELRFTCVPVLEVDGAQITQSNAMLRYAGRLANLYPSDDVMQSFYCDEILGAAEDVTNAIVRTFGKEGDALREAREKLVSGRLTVMLDGLEALLLRGGGTWFADDRFTVADLKAAEMSRWLSSGALEHIPQDCVQTIAPSLAEHHARVQAEPVVIDYYKSRRGQ